MVPWYEYWFFRKLRPLDRLRPSFWPRTAQSVIRVVGVVMTYFHFFNCAALCYLPSFFVYKCSRL